MGINRDVMSHSFGDGYATRSDEEGFGGIYGENQSFQKPQKDEPIHENHPGKRQFNLLTISISGWCFNIQFYKLVYKT